MMESSEARSLVADLLEQVGLASRAIDSGREFAALVERRQASLAVLDLFMERVDALRLAMNIRAAQPGIPVIIITQGPPGTPKAFALSDGDRSKQVGAGLAVQAVSARIETCLQAMHRPVRAAGEA